MQYSTALSDSLLAIVLPSVAFAIPLSVLLLANFIRDVPNELFESMRLDDLSHGEVLVRVRYAGVNYKDCLSLRGQAKIITEFPRVAGIELVGEVLDSSDPRFPAGRHVLVHGHQTGIAFDGGFAECARVPAKHLQAIPEGLTPHEAAILGVPAFTVAMCVER